MKEKLKQAKDDTRAYNNKNEKKKNFQQQQQPIRSFGSDRFGSRV